MGTVIVIAIAAFFLIGANNRAQLLAALGNTLQSAGQAVDNIAAAQGDTPEEVPYGGAAGAIPNSNGLNNSSSELQVQYLGSSSPSVYPHLSPGNGAKGIIISR